MSMIEEIRINNGYASRVMAECKEGDQKDPESKATIRHHFMRTDQYLEKFVSQFTTEGIENTLTPPNCRFLKTYPNRVSIAVIEEAPAMRSIRVSLDMSRDAESLKGKNQWKEFGYENFFTENKDRPYTFMLAMPYVIHVLDFSGNTFNGGKVFFRPKPLLGMSDILYRPPLLNINTNMSVCYGDSVYKGPQSSISSEIDHIIRVFWSSSFNSDYIDNYYKYSEVAGVCDYFTWQYYSQTNPMFIYTVDWIAGNKTIGHYIKKFEERNAPGESPFGFRNLSEVFNRSQKSNKMVAVGTRGGTRPLIYDICNGWFPEPHLAVYIGDPFKYSKDRIGFIDSFIGVSGRTRPMYTRIKVDDKLLIFKLNKKTSEFIATKIKELRYEGSVELPDKTILESGDIISVENNYGIPVYKKVYYIRKTPDDRLELRVGSEYWFFDTMDWSKIKKLDMVNPEVDGLKIKKDEEYQYFLSDYYPPGPLGRFTTVKFNDITTGENNSLVATFHQTEGTKGNVYNFNLSSTMNRPRKVYDISEMEDVPKVFFVARTLMSYINTTSKVVKVKRHKDFGIVTSNNCLRESSTSFALTCKEFLSKDGQHFHAESNNLNIDFSIGDKVVVADWKNPLSILSIKTIQGFAKDSDNTTINFLLEDKNGKSSIFEYVDLRHSSIMVGKIRKVTNELNGVTIGTKLIAKESGTSCFPKKDVNIIVAFIVDTGGEPLVLCSNGCTLWFTDLMEKFELIKMKSARWKKLNHAPLDPSKIKLQTGDIVNARGMYGNRRGYLVSKSNPAGGIRFARLDYYHEYDEYSDSSRTFLNQLILDCIPNPRFTVPKQKERGFVSGFPNFHGGISITPGNHSPYKFIDETGRF